MYLPITRTALLHLIHKTTHTNTHSPILYVHVPSSPTWNCVPYYTTHTAIMQSTVREWLPLAFNVPSENDPARNDPRAMHGCVFSQWNIPLGIRWLSHGPLTYAKSNAGGVPSGVSWPSGLAYRTQVLVLAAECGFESRPWHLCPWARHLTIIASLHPGVKWVLMRAELVDYPRPYMRCNGSNWAVYSPGSWDGFRNDLWAWWAGVIMRLEHHLVGGYVRYISPHIIIICGTLLFPEERTSHSDFWDAPLVSSMSLHFVKFVIWIQVLSHGEARG